MPIRQVYRNIKYRLFPPKVDLNKAFAMAHEAHQRDLETVASLPPEGQEYLARTEELSDPLTDGIDCNGPEEGV